MFELSSLACCSVLSCCLVVNSLCALQHWSCCYLDGDNTADTVDTYDLQDFL